MKKNIEIALKDADNVFINSSLMSIVKESDLVFRLSLSGNVFYIYYDSVLVYR